jgi:hypothetical protein
MSRISIDVTREEHQKLKALAALKGRSIKDYVIERTLGGEGDRCEASALKELEALLDGRIRDAENGAISKRTVAEIFKGTNRKAKGR